MNKRFLLPYLAVLLLITSCAPKAIQWSVARPLAWTDFLSGYNIGYDANTYWHIKYSYHKQPLQGQYVLDFKVQSLFIPSQSWIAPGKETDILLRHEQLHFDICELYARKLYLALTKHTYTRNYRNEIWGIANNNFKELKKTQVNYDTETRHSLNRGAQADWEMLIIQQLAQTPEIIFKSDSIGYRPRV